MTGGGWTAISLTDVSAEPPLRCWAEIDLAALERNLKRIQAALPAGVRYVAVVKADAYGHGMAPTAARLMQSGVDLFAVANVREGAALRELGAGWPVLVLSALLPDEDHWLLEHDLIATVSTAEEAERLNALGERAQRPVRAHLKIDTGMGRLGVWHEQAAALYARLAAAPGLRLEGVFTHFSSADSDPVFTAKQRERFLKTLAALEPQLPDGCLIHADNSASLDSFQAGSPFNAVRVGLLQFGVPPYPDSVLGRVAVEPVLSFHTRVGIIKDLPAGCPVSYGRTHTLAHDTRVAVLTAGYGDGVPLSLSNCGEVLVRGVACPILGRVTMDQTIIDVGAVPEAAPGDRATLIGTSGDRGIGLTEFSDRAGTIPWESLCSITQRVHRVYRQPREL